MAAKKEEALMDDGLTVVAEEKKPSYTGPMVDIFLPALEDGGGSLKVDQYEHVTIANENKETTYRVLRGEHVQVPVPVYVAMKAKYPNL